MPKGTMRKELDQIAEVFLNLDEENVISLSSEDKKMMKRWRRGTGALKKSLKTVGQSIGFKKNEWTLLDQGIHVFIKEAANRIDKTEEELYKIIYIDPEGNFIVPQHWEDKYRFIQKNYPEALTDKDSSDTISNPYDISIKLRANILEGKELYAEDLYKDFKELKNKFSDRKAKLNTKDTDPISAINVTGTWEGWSIYPLEGLPKNVFCYKIQTKFTQENHLIKVKEKIIKCYDVANDKVLKNRTERYQGQGKITFDNIGAIVKHENLAVFSVFHYVIQEGSFGEYLNELKGFVSIRKLKSKYPSHAFVRLRKVISPSNIKKKNSQEKESKKEKLSWKEALQEIRQHYKHTRF